MNSTDRRHFIRYVGAGLGTAWLQGCGSACPPPPACPQVSPTAPGSPAVLEQPLTASAEPSDANRPAAAVAPATRNPKVVFFDAFPIFDPRPVFKLAGELFPGAGPALAEEWRIRQFEYTWLRTASHQYKDFWHVTEDALRFACAKLELDLTNEKREQLLNKYLALPIWPDVADSLVKLRAKGLKLAFLSNMTENMLRSSARSAGIEQHFDEMLSTDLRETYKPNPKAYELGLETFKIERHEAVFVAFAGWDAAGAKWFGYPTFWNNRLRSQHERLDVEADAQGPTLDGVISFLES